MFAGTARAARWKTKPELRHRQLRWVPAIKGRNIHAGSTYLSRSLHRGNPERRAHDHRVATSITAFVGYTARGPVNKAIRILNFGDFERALGGLHRDSELSYAVQHFFLNGGTDAYVVRVALGAATAAVTLKDDAGNDVLIVSAANAGSWGNNLRLDIDYGTSNPDSTFNLSVTRYELQGGKFVPAETEQYRNLSMNSRSSMYAVNVIASASKLIQVSRPAGLTYARGYSLSGKLDPFPTLTAEDDTTITGIVDGTDPFTLVLVSEPTNMADLVTAVGAAITAAGMDSRLKPTGPTLLAQMIRPGIS